MGDNNDSLCWDCKYTILLPGFDTCGYAFFQCDWEMRSIGEWDTCVSKCSQYKFHNWQKGRQDDENQTIRDR